jgi:osmotically-inducible protein OsmY
MARLSTDKLLAKQPIQVQVHGGEVLLMGTVENVDQRRRAVQLAEGTLGVAKVVDRLEGP